MSEPSGSLTLAVVLSATVLSASLASPAPAQTIYNIGSTTTGEPLTFLDVKTNSIQGIMVDVIKAIAKDAGFAVDVHAIPFGALISSLTSNKIDLIATAMSITPARKEIIDFSDPVYAYSESLVVRDLKKYKTLDDLKGEVVGAQIDSGYTDALQKSGLFKEVREYAITDMLRDVNAGSLKAGFGDYPIVAYHLAQGTYPEVHLVRSYKPKFVRSIGIGVRKTDKELLAKINKSLAKLKADGTTDRILADWKIK
jgi:polar amino acid transport system substrate-binding protein